MRWVNTLLTLSFFTAAAMAAAGSNTTIVEIAPDQGCILAVGITMTTKDAGSLAEVHYTPYTAQAICGHGVNDQGKHLPWIDRTTTQPGQLHESGIFVFYGGLLPIDDKTKTTLADFSVCVIGPQHYEVDSGSNTVVVRRRDQVQVWDGSSLWYSSDTLYNVTLSGTEDPASFTKLPFECHKAGVKKHMDSALFTNPDFLKLLPSPYSDLYGETGSLVEDSWSSSSATVQLATATDAGSVAKRTALPNKSNLKRMPFGRSHRRPEVG